AIDADADPAARRDACVGDLLPGRRSDGPQLSVSEWRLIGAVGLELPRGQPERTALLAALGPLRHQIALAFVGAVDQEIDSVADRCGAGAGQRGLLPDDRGQVGVEGEDELLDLAALGVAVGPGGKAPRILDREVGGIYIEDDGIVEAAERFHAAVV